MSVQSCYYCHHNQKVAEKRGAPVSFKDSYSKKAGNLGERILCKLHAFKGFASTHKCITACVIISGVVLGGSLIAASALFISAAALPILLPIIAPTVSAAFILGLTCALTIGCSASIICSFFPLLASEFLAVWIYFCMEKAPKLSHEWYTNQERFKDQKVCLILEATEDDSGAFSRLDSLHKIERKCPIVFHQVSSLAELVQMAQEVKANTRGIEMLIIRGHGNQHNLILFRDERLHDTELKKGSSAANLLQELSGYLDPEATIFLDSCETANVSKGPRNLAGALSSVMPGHDVVASTKSFASSEVKIKSTGTLELEIRTVSSKNKIKEVVLTIFSVFLPYGLKKRVIPNCAVIYRDGKLKELP